MDSAAEQDELDELSACLGADWVDLPGLDITESVGLVISLLSEKLEEVPPEVRVFFGAPQKLEPLLVRRPIFYARGPSVV